MTAAAAAAQVGLPSPAAEPGWRQRVVRLALHTPLLDRILTHRAADISAKSGLTAHVIPHGLCVDIGSGLGHLLERVLACHSNVRGLGIDPQWRPLPAVQARLAGNGGRAQFCAADGRALPVGDGQAQTVLIAFVLHHLAPAHQELLLREAARVLAPGGRLILLEDTPRSERERRRITRADRRLNFEPRGGIHIYRTTSELSALLAGHGFAVETVTCFSRVFPPATLGPVPHAAFVCVRAG